MKTVMIFLTFSLVLRGLAMDGDWFDSPDGFKWPEAAATQLIEKQMAVKDLPKKLRAFLADQSTPTKIPEYVETARADLNGDGVMEWFLEIPALGGTGGRFYEILIQTKNGYASIGGVQGGFHFDVPEKGQKWLRIEGSSRGGGGHVTRYLLTYKDGEYRQTRNEDHDYNSGKAVLRK